MRRQRRTAALLVIAWIGLASTASAQERKGFWFDIDGGAGSMRLSSDNGSGPREWNGVGALAAGWAVNPRLLAGFEMRIMTLDVTGFVVGTMDVYNVMGRVAYYPYASRGFFVKGAAGGTFIDLNVDQQGTTFTANIAKGPGLGAGVGYDVYLGRGFSLTPAVTYWYGRTGSLNILGETFFDGGWTHDVIDMTIGVSFH
jgi:hypothetical protein